LTFLFVSLSVLGLDWLFSNFHRLKRERKMAVYFFLGVVMFVVGIELITPLLITLITPANSEGYMMYTQNYFTGHTVLVVISVLIIMAFMSIRLLGIKIKRYSLHEIFHSPKTLVAIIAVFCAFNLVVANLPLFSGDDFKEQSDVTPGVVELIPSDGSEPVWINFSEPIFPFRLNQVTLVEEDMFLASGLFGSAKAYYRDYKPEWNVTIGGDDYSIYDYEFAQYEINDTDHIYVGQFNITTFNESIDPSSEPGSISELSSSRFRIVKNYYNATIYVYRMNNSLPNAFILRDDEVIPIEITHYSPNRIEVRAENVQAGDRIVFKGSYYPGWKAGTKDSDLKEAVPYQRMIGYEAKEGGANKTYVFEFSPDDFVTGGTITLLYFPVAVLLYFLVKKKKIFTF